MFDNCFTKNGHKKMKLGITIKIVVRSEQKKADGTNVIYLRITKDRKARYLATGLVATSADLSRDRKKIKNYQLNDQAEALLRRARHIILQHASEFVELDASEIVPRLATYIAIGERLRLDLFEYYERHLPQMARATAVSYTSAINHFAEFVGVRKFEVVDLSKRVLKQYAEFLLKKGISPLSANTYAAKIIALHKRAREEYNDDEAEEIAIPRILHNPISNAYEPRQRALTIEQIQALIDVKITRSRWQQIARDAFLLSFFLCGMNFSDFATASAPVDGVIRYRRAKIARRAGQAAEMEIKIPEEIKPILERYADPKGKRLTWWGYAKDAQDKADNRIIKNRAQIGYAIKYLSKQLGFYFTFYSARHSFATIARNVLKVDKATIDECLAHVGAHKMTDIYIKRDYSAVNSVCSSIVSLFNFDKYDGKSANL